MGHRHFSKTLKISTGKNRALMTRKDDAATNMATMAARQCTASILCEWATKIISKIAVPMPGFKLCICRGPQMTSEWGTCTCYFGKCLQDMYGSVWKYGLPKKLPYFTKMDDDDSEFSLNVQSKQKKTCHDRPSITHHYIHYIHCHCQLLITHRPVTRSSSIFFQACQMAPVSHGSRCQRCPKTLIVLCIFLFINYQTLLYHAISQYRQKKRRYIYNTIRTICLYMDIVYTS